MSPPSSELWLLLADPSRMGSRSWNCGACAAWSAGERCAPPPCIQLPETERVLPPSPIVLLPGEAARDPRRLPRFPWYPIGVGPAAPGRLGLRGLSGTSARPPAGPGGKSSEADSPAIARPLPGRRAGPGPRWRGGGCEHNRGALGAPRPAQSCAGRAALSRRRRVARLPRRRRAPRRGAAGPAAGGGPTRAEGPGYPGGGAGGRPRGASRGANIQTKLVMACGASAAAAAAAPSRSHSAAAASCPPTPARRAGPPGIGPRETEEGAGGPNGGNGWGDA
jgi:hypothetical protein